MQLSGMKKKMQERMVRLAHKARTTVLSSDLNTAMDETSTIVAVRMRPPNKREKQLDSRSVFASTTAPSIENTKVIKVGKRAFTFDAVIGSGTSQNDVYKVTAKQILKKVLAGFNGTVMAYGQTGSGKTYTMQGVHDSPGIIPRICGSVFLAVREDAKIEYDISCSYVEIYNENLHDLLTKEKTTPIIVEDAEKGITLKNIITATVKSQIDVQDLFDRGATQRAVGFTEMNAESSRSHAVFTIYVKSQNVDDSEGLTRKMSKFHLIDLAGSERADRTGAKGTRLKEGAMINQSLSALGNVINALTKATSSSHQRKSNNSTKHVPYRSSKLTRLLQDSLGGNSYTMLICNISPAKSSIAETLSSLRFAERAKQVQNKATVNQDPKALARLRLMEENNRLLEMVHSLRSQMVDAGVKPKVVAPKPKSPMRGRSDSKGGTTRNSNASESSGDSGNAAHTIVRHAESVDSSASSTGSRSQIGMNRAFSSPDFSRKESSSHLSIQTVDPSNRYHARNASVDSVELTKVNDALKDVNSEASYLSKKLSELDAGRKRVRDLQEKVKVHQQELINEQSMLEQELHLAAALEDKLSQSSSHSNTFAFSTESNVITAQLNNDGKLSFSALCQLSRQMICRGSVGPLGEITRQNKEDRVEEALQNVQRDESDHVDYGEFVSLLAKYAERDSDIVGSLEGSRSTTTSFEARSRSATQYKRSIDDVIGHHKVLVGTKINMSTRNLTSVIDQLEGVEALLDKIKSTSTPPERPYSKENNSKWAQLKPTTNVNGGVNFSTTISTINTIDTSTPTSTNQLTKIAMNKLHSLIRWNKYPQKISSLLEAQPGLASVPDSRNGNIALHIAAQNGHIDITRMLINGGAEINSQNTKGNTALHVSFVGSAHSDS
jgi:hypothetical protein